MIVIPSVQVRTGRVASTAPGTAAIEDPTGHALHLAELGAKRVQLVNLDAAGGIDDPRTRRAVRSALNALRDSGVTVDVAGGVRSRPAAEFWLESGAATALIGTLAVYRPDIAGEICRAFPGQIILGLDVRGTMAHSEGWIRDAGEATLHLRRWAPWPAAGVIRNTGTTISSFSADIDALRDCIGAYAGPLICSSGPRVLTDLAQAAAAGAAAVIIDPTLPTLDTGLALRLFPGASLQRPASPHG